ncbi:MAG: hypothetical protein P8R38_05320 [Planctomycetota bacterium]|jgi:uncharacterized repeat protein (TIGR04138 family)|nr:hypothetical protein [Planctomycetota bacterium]
MPHAAVGPGPGGDPLTDPKPEQRLDGLLRVYPEYPREAYAFLFDTLDHAVRQVHHVESYVPLSPEDHQHVSARDLLESVRQLAIQEFGCLAGCVFDSWGIVVSEDIGAMVFALIDHQLLGRRASDRIADFDRGFGGLTFHEVFSIEPQLEYCQEKDQWIASYRSVS